MKNRLQLVVVMLLIIQLFGTSVCDSDFEYSIEQQMRSATSKFPTVQVGLFLYVENSLGAFDVYQCDVKYTDLKNWTDGNPVTGDRDLPITKQFVIVNYGIPPDFFDENRAFTDTCVSSEGLLSYFDEVQELYKGE